MHVFIEQKKMHKLCLRDSTHSVPVELTSKCVCTWKERESFIGDESKFWLYAGLIKKLYSDAHPYTHTHIRLNYT